MGRELKRVPLDFKWPLDKTWEGFVNPLHAATKCEPCDGTGYSLEGKRLKDLWYGYILFRPEDRGSVPFTPDHPVVHAFALRQIERSPEYYGRGERAVIVEAARLCRSWNGSWSHHLNADDVAALIEGGRLYDLTHTWKQGDGWKPKDPPCHPTPQEVNAWSLSGMGHDSINQWICLKAECKRLGVSHTCTVCEGEGEIWPSAEAKQAYEDWQPTPPPSGEGYQIWETVSEGSPISPVFSTARDLAQHMATTRWGGDEGTSAEQWLKFIEGPGWAPSLIMRDGVMQSGGLF